MKRMIIAVTVPDEMDDATAATLATAIGTDPIAWEWPAFWADVTDEVITPDGENYPGTCIGCTSAEIMEGHRERCPDRVESYR